MDSIDTCFRLNVLHGRLPLAVEQYREALGRQQTNAFSPLVGLDFLHHTEEAAANLIRFLESASAQREVGALYFEMNGFDINPDRWYCNGYAYDHAGGVRNTEWLVGWFTADDEDFVLTGMEPVQAAFAAHDGDAGPLFVNIARELSIYLVTCRFMELIAAAHQLAGERDSRARNLPVFATAHGFDIAHRTGAEE